MRLNTKTVVGFAVTVLLLWWAMRDVSPAHVVHEIRTADPVLLTLAVIIQLLGLVIRAARWGVLLEPTDPGVRFRPRLVSTVIGFAANNVIPARVGEFARAYSLRRLAGIPIAAVFGTLVIERIFDGLVIVSFLFLSMGAASFPAADPSASGIDPRAAARAVALLMGALGAVLLLLVLAPQRAVSLFDQVVDRIVPRRFRAAVRGGLRAFVGSLAVLRDTRLFALSVVWAVGQWAFLALSFLVAFRAFGIEQVDFAGAVFLQSLVSLLVAVPSSPGFFGPYEFASKVGLQLWGVDSARAVSFAVGFHLAGFVPVTLWGMYYVWRLGLRWKDLEQADDRVERGMEREVARTAEPS